MHLSGVSLRSTLSGEKIVVEEGYEKSISVCVCVMVLVFGLIGNINAALIDRGNGMIYDSDQNITCMIMGDRK
jgi:hypothetical protein